MGCSFAYGQGVNDTQTMAYYLQQKEKGYKIQNYAVGGYGTVQQCLQLQAVLAQKKHPEVVVFTYASFHHERNAGSRKYIKMMAFGSGNQANAIRIPYWNNKNQLCYRSINYPLLNLCRISVLVNTTDDLVNKTLFEEEKPFSTCCIQIL
ncbi:MAG: hypothetical protein U0T32_02895 [Chitinophagales bacterium]